MYLLNSRFGVYTAVNIQVEFFFWDVTPCCVAVGYLRFGGHFCLHLQEHLTLKIETPTVLRNVGILTYYLLTYLLTHSMVQNI
jgi:hypothetical protein